jgi:ABC-type polysaccharide/polyol phosphate export permease
VEARGFQPLRFAFFGGWGIPLDMLKNLFVHRRFLFGSFWSEFRFRYAGSVLGVFWFIVNPILEAALYSFVFSYLIGLRGDGRGDSYIIFLLCGLFPWLGFSSLISRGSNALNTSAVYLRRLAVSTDVFVAKESLIALMSLLIYMIILIPANMAFGNQLSWSMLILPVLAFLLVALGFGVSLILSHLRVFFPDVGEILGVLIQLWRWTLPINYSLDMMPEWARTIMQFNPPYYFFASIRDVYLNGKLPSSVAWIHMLAWTFVFGLLGSIVSKRLGSEVKDLM